MDSAAGEFRRRYGVEKANRAILQFRRSKLDVRINIINGLQGPFV